MTSPTPFGTLEDLPESVAVEHHRTSVPLAVVALVAGGVLAAVVAVFVAFTVVNVSDAASDPSSCVAGCTGLSLDEVERSAGLDFPDGSEVLSASSAAGVFTASVLLPGDELPEFALYGYGSATAPSDDLASTLDGEAGTPVAYFAASTTGITGAAAQLDRDGRTVVVVDVRTAD